MDLALLRPVNQGVLFGAFSWGYMSKLTFGLNIRLLVSIMSTSD